MEKIPDLVTIAGPNGCGKTSIFEAIRIFKAVLGPYHDNELNFIRNEVRNQLGNLINLDSDTATISISFELSTREKSYLKEKSFDIEKELQYNNDGLLQGILEITKSGGTNVKSNPSSLNEILRHYEPTDELGAIMYIPSVRDLPAGDIGNITLSQDWMEQQKQQITGNIRSKFQQMKQNFAMMFIYDQIHITEKASKFIPKVQQVFSDFFYPKQFLGVNVDRALAWHFPVKHGSGTHDVDFLSSGEKEILMTYTEILKLKHTGSVILFDEPDLHLNAALERKVIGSLNQIVRESNQVWIVTHSLEIIGTVPIENLYKMSLNPKGKNNQIELCSEKKDVFEIFRDLGASIGTQLISDKIVYVEGPSDIEVLNTFYEEFGDKLSFIETKGVKGITGLSYAITSLLEKAAKFDSFLMIRDRDFLTEEERQQIISKYKGRVHVWNKRNLENFLLDAKVLFNVFKHLGIPIQTLDEVHTVIKTSVDNLKIKTITEMAKQKLFYLFNRIDFGLPDIQSGDIEAEILNAVKPIRDSHVKKLEDSEIEKIIRQCKLKIENDWGENWDTLCDGKAILANIINDYLTPMNKNISLSAFRSLIINEMKKSGCIPTEITEFFKKHGYEISTKPKK